jgi:hypothetical protein
MCKKINGINYSLTVQSCIPNLECIDGHMYQINRPGRTGTGGPGAGDGTYGPGGNSADDI